MKVIAAVSPSNEVVIVYLGGCEQTAKRLFGHGHRHRRVPGTFVAVLGDAVG